ncbi:MAG: molybdopterin-dependent oxidoreductase [Myxococcales bacterium]|nr:molybdopterin-dependent oxidoreductase [Myxococcales bacterium]
MNQVHPRSCPLCEATCGLAITTEGDQVVSIVGDERDPLSRGYLCPKGVALADLHHDPDRLRRPMIREGQAWRESDWEEALALVANRLSSLRRDHGANAVGIVQGNPSVHNLGLLLYAPLLLGALDTESRFSATSLDQLPHMLAALHMFGNPYLLPVPDIDRTDLLIVLGGNPLVSNGSLMTAPDIRNRLRAISGRGGKVVVIDPRRTETAARADQHLFIRPGTDAALLLALCHVMFTESLVSAGRLASHTAGLVELRQATASWSAERAATVTGIAAEQIRQLARDLAGTRRAVLYGRLGVCTQEFGGLSAWLCYAVNALAGHLDEEGGLMFSSPAVDLLPLAKRLGLDGSYATRRSRVSHHPEFGGEWPMSALAEEIETPGQGQIRGLITMASNPVLSVPNGRRVERALRSLDFLVAIDPHLNETTRLAHVILPPTSALERPHYDLVFNTLAVRNSAKFSPALFPRQEDQRHDWEICLELWARLGGVTRRLGKAALHRLGPEGLLDLLLRAGPRGLRRGRHGLSLRKLRESPHGLDLGPLESRLPERLGRDQGGQPRKLQLAPPVFLADLPRLAAHADAARPAPLVMIGRRDLRSNNSWMHNSERLVKGPDRCTLLMNPDDAAARGLSTGSRATARTTVGAIDLPVEVTADIMRGVVSIPHGWGHARAGARLRVAAAHPGASMNDITDDSKVDPLSGTAILTGLPVEVVAAEP